MFMYMNYCLLSHFSKKLLALDRSSVFINSSVPSQLLSPITKSSCQSKISNESTQYAAKATQAALNDTGTKQTISIVSSICSFVISIGGGMNFL